MTTDPQRNLETILEHSAALHHHLCPRQVLGARIGLLAGERLGLRLPRLDKRLLVLVETDGCFADGIGAATGCWLGRRTMRLFDHGKIAATFVDTASNRSLRVAPHPEARARAIARAAPDQSRWQAYLEGYQVMPDEELLTVREVTLTLSWRDLIGSRRDRAVCARCSEEIVNGREVVRGDQTLCLNCAGSGYWGALELQ